MKHLGTLTHPPRIQLHCDCCGYDQRNASDLQRFGGKLACDPCVRVGMCKTCRTDWAAAGADECAPCTEKFYCAHPEERPSPAPVPPAPVPVNISICDPLLSALRKTCHGEPLNQDETFELGALALQLTIVRMQRGSGILV